MVSLDHSGWVQPKISSPLEVTPHGQPSGGTARAVPVSGIGMGSGGHGGVSYSAGGIDSQTSVGPSGGLPGGVVLSGSVFEKETGKSGCSSALMDMSTSVDWAATAGCGLMSPPSPDCASTGGVGSESSTIWMRNSSSSVKPDRPGETGVDVGLGTSPETGGAFDLKNARPSAHAPSINLMEAW